MADPIEPGQWTGSGGGGGGSWSFDFGGLSPLFNALLARYGQAMDYQIQDLANMPSRNAQAFEQWKTGKEFGREAQAFSLNEAAQRQKFDEQAMLRAEQIAEDQRMRALDEERKALLASVARAQEQQSTTMSPWGFTPEGAVADYYQYGGGRVGGPGGGAAAPREKNYADPCTANPYGPGCPEDPLRKNF